MADQLVELIRISRAATLFPRLELRAQALDAKPLGGDDGLSGRSNRRLQR